MTRVLQPLHWAARCVLAAVTGSPLPPARRAYAPMHACRTREQCKHAHPPTHNHARTQSRSHAPAAEAQSPASTADAAAGCGAKGGRA